MSKYRRDEVITPRPSFSEQNALRFIQVFDVMLDKGEDVILNPATLDLAYTTFRHRLSEALLWCSIYPVTGSKRPPAEYARLKGMVRFKQHNDGDGIKILAHFLKHQKSLIPGDVTVTHDRPKDITQEFKEKSWRIKVINFLSDPGQNILVLDGVKQIGSTLSELDITWLKNTFESADISYEVRSTIIKAAK